jgi:tRNA pseudouridine38-40 synthase
MKKAAKYIVGTHDFACFQSAGGQVCETTVRTVFSLDIYNSGQDIIIEIAGDGFLYNMVRNITGTLVEVGLGKKEPEDLEFIIQSKNRENAGHKAPAGGLYLVEVYYE